MYFGHLTVTYAARGVLRERIAFMRPVAPLLLGAILPDLVDKPFKHLLGLPPRGLAHSAIVLVIAFVILLRLLPRHRETLGALAVGAALHLLEDWPYLHILLWPLLGGWEYFPLLPLDEGIAAYYRGETHLWMLLFEVASWPVCLYYFLKRGRSNPPSS